MPDSHTVAQRQQPHRGWIAELIALPFQLFGVLCGSLLLAVLMEWIGMLFFWPDQGVHHAERMVHDELGLLSSEFRRSIVIEKPVKTAQQLIEWTHEHVVVQSGLSKWMESSSRLPDERGPGLKPLVKLAYDHLEPFIIAAGYTTLTIMVRLVVLSLSLPIFFTATFVGLIDGLVRRDLRRFGAGRESGFIHHRARTFILPFTILPWVVYLALPISVHPLWIVLPAAILLSVAVNVTVGSFKKYL